MQFNDQYQHVLQPHIFMNSGTRRSTSVLFLSREKLGRIRHRKIRILHACPYPSLFSFFLFFRSLNAPPPAHCLWLAINRGKPSIKNYGRAKVGRESIDGRRPSNCCGQVGVVLRDGKSNRCGRAWQHN